MFHFTRSLSLFVVVLGAFEVWSVQGMAYRGLVRPSKTIGEPHREEEKVHQPYAHHPQYPTAKEDEYLAKPTPQPSVVDEYDWRDGEGNYIFWYVLSDATTRYETGYFTWVGDKQIPVKKGYYSYRQPDLMYYTVFYIADQYGFRQNASYSTIPPVLPKSLTPDEDQDVGPFPSKGSSSKSAGNVLGSE